VSPGGDQEADEAGPAPGVAVAQPQQHGFVADGAHQRGPAPHSGLVAGGPAERDVGGGRRQVDDRQRDQAEKDAAQPAPPRESVDDQRAGELDRRDQRQSGRLGQQAEAQEDDADERDGQQRQEQERVGGGHRRCGARRRHQPKRRRPVAPGRPPKDEIDRRHHEHDECVPPGRKRVEEGLRAQARRDLEQQDEERKGDSDGEQPGPRRLAFD
jgi:hypothetical protein